MKKLGILCVVLPAVLLVLAFFLILLSTSGIIDINRGINWVAFAIVLVILPILAIFLSFEKTGSNSRTIALLGVLTAITIVSRQLLHSFGEFSPVFLFVITAGYVFGPVNGFMVGAMTILISNFSLGQGPWTPFQMTALGIVGFLSYFVPRFGNKGINIVFLILFGVISAYLYGAITDLWYWSAFASQHTIETYIAILFAGILPDTARAIGNALFIAVLGPAILKILERFRKRLYLSTEPALPQRV